MFLELIKDKYAVVEVGIAYSLNDTECLCVEILSSIHNSKEEAEAEIKWKSEPNELTPTFQLYSLNGVRKRIEMVFVSDRFDFEIFDFESILDNPILDLNKEKYIFKKITLKEGSSDYCNECGKPLIEIAENEDLIIAEEIIDETTFWKLYREKEKSRSPYKITKSNLLSHNLKKIVKIDEWKSNVSVSDTKTPFLLRAEWLEDNNLEEPREFYLFFLEVKGKNYYSEYLRFMETDYLSNRYTIENAKCKIEDTHFAKTGDIKNDIINPTLKEEINTLSFYYLPKGTIIEIIPRKLSSSKEEK